MTWDGGENSDYEEGYEHGAQAEREKWKKAICATDTIDAPVGGVIGVKAYWVDVKKLAELGITLEKDEVEK